MSNLERTTLHKQKQNCIMHWKKTDIFSVRREDLVTRELSGNRCFNVLVKAQTLKLQCICECLSICVILFHFVVFVAFSLLTVWVCKVFHMNEKIFLIVCGSSRWNLWCLLFFCPFYQIVAKRCWENIILFCFPQNIFFLCFNDNFHLSKSFSNIFNFFQILFIILLNFSFSFNLYFEGKYLFLGGLLITDCSSN